MEKKITIATDRKQLVLPWGKDYKIKDAREMPELRRAETQFQVMCFSTEYTFKKRNLPLVLFCSLVSFFFSFFLILFGKGEQ